MSIKGHDITDLIVELPQNDEVVVHEEFLDEYQDDPHNQ